MPINFIVIPAVVIATGFIGAHFTKEGLKNWYPYLHKPKNTPSGETIGLIWTTLFFLIAFSVLWYWNIPVFSFWHYIIGAILLINAFLNAYWNKIFFIEHNIEKAFKEMILLNATTIAAMILMIPNSYISPFLLLPYVLWVAFATKLTKDIMILNKKTS